MKKENSNNESEQAPVGSTVLVARLRKGYVVRMKSKCVDYASILVPDLSATQPDELMHEAADRIEELEAAIRRAEDKFFVDGSDVSAAAAMMQALKDADVPRGATAQALAQPGRKETL